MRKRENKTVRLNPAAWKMLLALLVLIGFPHTRDVEGVTKEFQAPIEVFPDDLVEFQVGPLSFGGTIQAGAGRSGTVTVNPDGTQEITGTVQVSSPFTPAQYTVTGAPNAFYYLGLPTSWIATRVEDGVTTLNVSDFKSMSQTRGVVSTIGKLGPGGTDTVFVGATLHVPPGSKSGKYVSTFNITVSYGP